MRKSMHGASLGLRRCAVDAFFDKGRGYEKENPVRMALFYDGRKAALDKLGDEPMHTHDRLFF